MRVHKSQQACLRTGILVLVFYLVFAPMCAQAQIGDTGQIQGTVKDASGAVIPGATVTATAVDTSQTSTAVTNARGNYIFPSLPIGQYTIQVKMKGFKTAVHSGITLDVQQVAVVDVAMQVGAVNQSVQVTGAAPLLDTQTASQGQVIDSRRILDLPLNGRDYVQLALLSQGTVQPISNSRFGGFSTDGQRATQNNYMINGVDNNDLEIAAQGRQAEVVKPIVDAVQQFKVQTNGYSAEFGKAMGGVLNLKVKSGTNQFHGSAWEFVRNEVLDARDYFNAAPQPKAPFRRNQFGATFGGPVVKNKLFFFQAMEWQRRREYASVVNSLATLKMRQGDFSELSTPIYDPSTYDPNTGTRQAFDGNIIPSGRIDPVAAQLLALVPDPQTSDLARNYTFSSPRGFNTFSDDARVDYIMSSKDNFSGTFDWQSENDFTNNSFPGFMGGGTPFIFHGTVASAQWNHVFGPSVITSTKVAWNRRFTDRTPPFSQNLNAQVGLNGVDQSLAGVASINLTGFTNLGLPAHVPNVVQSQDRQVVNDTTVIKGNHQIKFGGSVQWLQSFLDNPQQALGVFNFDGHFTRNPLGNVGGNALADFLLGIPDKTTVATPIHNNLRAPYYAAYVQDSWKVTPKLTLNYGLRYELFLPWVDKQDRMANFNPNPIFAPQVRLILAQNGPSRESRSLVAADSNNFGPRIGIAYDLGHGTVVRAAYGIFYGTMEGPGGGKFLGGNYPFTFSSVITTDSITPALTLAGGVPDVLTPENARSANLSSVQNVFDFPYTQQWNFNIQHSFSHNWMLQLGYYGAGTHHLLTRFDLNEPPPGPGNINSRRPFSSVIFPGSSVVISPLGDFTDMLYLGNSTYNSLQAKVEKRFSGGFTLLSSYIFSKTLGDTCGFSGSGTTPGCGPQNIQNLKAEKGPDNQDRRHRFVASYIYDLPFGRGRHFGNGWNGAVDAVLGGWSTEGILTLTSGGPFTITVASNPANISTTYSVNRPNLVGDPARPSGADPVNEFFNTAAFAPNAPYTFGNLGRNTMVGPSLADWDFGLFKHFNITERVGAQFRFEAFNATNTPNFGTPGNSLGTPNFGVITSSGLGRKLQLALKLSF